MHYTMVGTWVPAQYGRPGSGHSSLPCLCEGYMALEIALGTTAGMLTGVSPSLLLSESCVACVFALLRLQVLALSDGYALEPKPGWLTADDLAVLLSPQGSGPVQKQVRQCLMKKTTRRTSEQDYHLSAFLHSNPCGSCLLSSVLYAFSTMRVAGAQSSLQKRPADSWYASPFSSSSI